MELEIIIWRVGWKRLTLAMEKYLKSGVLNKADIRRMKEEKSKGTLVGDGSLMVSE